LKPRLVIFDCDGVLVDSEPIACGVLREALAEIGLPFSYGEVIAQFAGRSRESIVQTLRKRGVAVPLAFTDHLHERQLAALAAQVEPMPGAVELLEAVDRAGMRSCVASSSGHDRIRLSLSRAGLRRFFSEDRIFSAADVPRGKPEPDLFLHAADRMGVPPAHALVIEDSVAGVAAARAAGMDVCAFAGTFDAGDLRAVGATRVVCDLREIRPIAMKRLGYDEGTI